MIPGDTGAGGAGNTTEIPTKKLDTKGSTSRRDPVGFDPDTDPPLDKQPSSESDLMILKIVFLMEFFLLK